MSDDAGVAAQIAELAALGRQFLDAGQLAEAENIFQGLRSVTESDFEVNKQLGIVLATRGDFAGARAPLEDAVRLHDRDAVVFNVLSVCACETGDNAAALVAADRAVRLRRTYPEAHNSRGNALLRLGRPAEAAEAFKAALSLTPRDPEVHVNLANALESQGRPVEALRSVDRAIALEPGLAAAHVNRGNVLQQLGRHRDAVAAYDRALDLAPGSVDAHWNRGLCHLLMGDYAAGWPDYEWRWRRGARETQPRGFAQPLWLGGEDLAGRTILLHAEQGQGDALQFARYAPQVAARGGRVILEVFPSLAPLLAGLPGVAAVVARGDALPAFDLQCPLMSLPLALGVPDPAPSPKPYLRAEPERAAAWAARLGPPGERLRVGLVCSGSPTHGRDAQRSLPFAMLAPHLPAGPAYHLLQKEIRDSDRDPLATRPDVAVWSAALGDFADTAALAEQMDLVISVDTSVAHLAGALGRPVWVLLPTEPDWRWGLQGETTPWYATMRLLRQAVRDDWAAPLAQVGADLAGLAGHGAA
jgi:Flp pilus assembly protein TadD